MRVLAVSVAPLFPGVVMGGSQRVLMDVVDALAEAGHDVRVLCSQVDGTGDCFSTKHGAVIEPNLPLRGAFPAPYQVTPHRLKSAWRALAEAAIWAERVYLHADAIYMRAALGDTPIVRSLHDFVYEEALISAFALPAGRTIVPSQYLADCVMTSAGTVTDVGEPVVIPNGVNVPDGRVTPVLPAGVAPRQGNDLLLLHPHRLHAEKGIEESMRIAVEVQKRIPGRSIRLLVPAPDRGGSLDEAAAVGSAVMDFARSVGADGLLEFHRWLGAEEMPGYYAAGDVTLCPGRFVESFGLVPLESVVAGTPAICTRVGALREKAGVPGVSLVDYGDIAAATSAVVEAVVERFDVHEAQRTVRLRYSMDAMKAGYVDAITGKLTEKRQAASSSSGESWRLAPWCYVDGDRIFHDYLGRFEQFPTIAAALSSDSRVVDTTGVDPAELTRTKREGFIVRG
jgi:glycosyltransferase involved in cell wall biosynthesis